MSLGIAKPWNAVAHGYDRTVRKMLEPIAEAAVDWSGVETGARVLDLACGPGTLTSVVASRASVVLAMDLSPDMVDLCKQNCKKWRRVEVCRGDGQSLRIDGGYDAAFSTFGLMYFSDRAAGFAGLIGALDPGGVGVVTSWAPPKQSSARRAEYHLMKMAFPDVEILRSSVDPLDSEEKMREEMEEAGFADVQIKRVVHPVHLSRVEFWRTVVEGNPDLVMARQRMSDKEWHRAEARGLAWLAAAHDPTEPLEYVAIMGKGQRE